MCHAPSSTQHNGCGNVDNFHINTETIKSGDFLNVFVQECKLIAHGTIQNPTKTVGDVMKLISAGKLPMTSMIFVTLAVILVFSTSLMSRAIRLFTAHDELNNPYGKRNSGGSGSKADEEEEEEEEKEIILRDFTIVQLRAFNGASEETKAPSAAGVHVTPPAATPIYISLKGNVYDVTSAKDLYGPGQTYHCMAGREASRALAKLSFEESDLGSTDLTDLGPFQRETLGNWEEKFIHYKSYPVVGKCIFNPDHVPDASIPLKQLKKYTAAELAVKTGKQEVPAGRINAPILIGINGKVIDVSFGGIEMYGVGGPYHLFAGKDSSRALAKMSFAPEDVNSTEVSDLDGSQKQVLLDWEKRFLNVKKYPVVGTC